MTFADRIMAFNKSLDFKARLPEGIHIMNPFKENPEAIRVSTEFYHEFFNDNNKRYLILGINPGRFGAGATGIPFTDTIRLNQKCGIRFDDFRTYEPSSAFVYEMIEAFGGVRQFYSSFLISALCPLGFTKTSEKGKELNYNYYDSPELTLIAYDFIVETLKQQIDLGIHSNKCFCLGTGKNDAFLRKLNNRFGFFESIITLEHPRYIMQYKAKSKEHYIKKYVDAFRL
jgi:hypothetical protein